MKHKEGKILMVATVNSISFEISFEYSITPHLIRATHDESVSNENFAETIAKLRCIELRYFELPVLSKNRK